MSLATKATTIQEPYSRRVVSRLRADRRVLYALTALALLLGVAFTVLAPPFLGPDETGHFDYVRSLWESGGARVTGVEVSQPGAYYWLESPLYALTSGQSQQLQVAVMRLGSVALFVGEILFAYLTARALSPGSPFVYLSTAAFVALLPGRIAIAATINNDNLANLVSAGVLYLLARGLVRGFDRIALAGLIVLVPIGILSKSTAWAVVGIAVAVTSATVAAMWWRGSSWRPVAASLLTLTAPAILVVTGYLMWDKASASTAQLLTKIQAVPFPQPEPFVMQFKSFWIPVWWDDYAPPDWSYGLALGLAFCGAAGLALRVARAQLRRAEKRAVPAPSARGAAILALVALVVWVIPVVRYMWVVADIGTFITDRGNMWSMHGRFLYPALVPLAYLLSLGLERLLPRRLHPAGLAALIALLLCLNAVAIYDLVSRVYWWAS